MPEARHQMTPERAELVLTTLQRLADAVERLAPPAPSTIDWS